MSDSSKSSDCQTFAYIKLFFFYHRVKKDNYDFRAKSGIPIIQTGLYRLTRTCFYSGFLPCIFLCEKKQDFTVYLHYRLKYYKEGTYIILSWKTSLFQLLA